VSKQDIKSRIERVLSDIFSDKYDAEIGIKFKKRGMSDGDSNSSRIIEEKQILD
jgi:hypothetical protein